MSRSKRDQHWPPSDFDSKRSPNRSCKYKNACNTRQLQKSIK